MNFLTHEYAYVPVYRGWRYQLESGHVYLCQHFTAGVAFKAWFQRVAWEEFGMMVAGLHG